MICDKCGKNNKASAPQCTYCGTELPKISAGNGFADIFTFRPPEQSSSDNQNNETERISVAEMQKLINKSDKIIASTGKNTKLAIVAVILCIIILLGSVLINITLTSKLNNLEAKINEIITRQETEITADDSTIINIDEIPSDETENTVSDDSSEEISDVQDNSKYMDYENTKD